MVVIGHSQGGLLTKMMAIESGTRFWDAISEKPFDQVSMSPETRALLQEMLFFEPLPFVKRVVFIATPHRGSYLAAANIVRRLAARLIRMPGDLASVAADAVHAQDALRKGVATGRLATAIDNMSPSDPYIRASAGIPIAPGITANSIIALRPGESRETGGDGVVKFQSAHIDGVESEFVVASSHSTQANPNTIEEVRRILLLHAERSACTDRQLGAQVSTSLIAMPEVPRRLAAAVP
jgi:hypothetical protein